MDELEDNKLPVCLTHAAIPGSSRDPVLSKPEHVVGPPNGEEHHTCIDGAKSLAISMRSVCLTPRARADAHQSRSQVFPFATLLPRQLA